MRNNSDMASEIENSIKLKLGIQDGIDTEEKKIDDGVYRIATRLLTRREFTKKNRNFCSKGFAMPDVDNVIDQLEISGLLSNRRYVDGYIRSRRSRYGHLKILYSLKKLGVIKSELSRAQKS